MCLFSHEIIFIINILGAAYIGVRLIVQKIPYAILLT